VTASESEYGDYGHAVEEDVRQIVAQLGVVDFVYTVPPVTQGAGTREVGDALLFSNGMGAILQVKSRQPGARAEDGSTWVIRRGEKAYSQGRGTRRMIARRQESGSTLFALPVRTADWSDTDRAAAALDLSMDVSGWPIIIILDHPSIGDVDPPHPDAFWITTSDWLWLNRALRSVTAVLTYVRRVLDGERSLAVPLGHEADRFRRVVGADLRFASEGGTAAMPWLTADSLRDPRGADLYRELLTRLWPPDAVRPHVAISDLRRVLEFLDAAPPGSQAKIGRWILKKRGDLRTGPRASGAVMWSGDRLLVFGCAQVGEYEDIDRFDADLAALAAVRAREIHEQGGHITVVLSVGHLVADGYIDYRYIYMEPPLEAPEDLKQVVLHTFGRFDLAAGRAVTITAGRNDPCPCGSGKKFKNCGRP
jgi:SEC-C motif-containing protein